jgi:hypothetical protein
MMDEDLIKITPAAAGLRFTCGKSGGHRGARHALEKVEVDVAGDLYSAQISRKAPYDPTSARVKS